MRHYEGQQDIEVWLDLRRRAFARQKLGIRDWNRDDFQREFLDKPWWRPECMWFAEKQLLLLPSAPVGSVTLARRGNTCQAKPVVHWLLVLPGHRRRGVGRMLMNVLEATAWDLGERQIWLETHAQWTEAVMLYEALGYRSAAN